MYILSLRYEFLGMRFEEHRRRLRSTHRDKSVMAQKRMRMSRSQIDVASTALKNAHWIMRVYGSSRDTVATAVKLVMELRFRGKMTPRFASIGIAGLPAPLLPALGPRPQFQPPPARHTALHFISNQALKAPLISMKTIIRGLSLIICLLTFAANAQTSLTNGLVAYDPLDGDTLDYSGSANHATAMNGAAPALDRFGNATGCYAFNGSGQYLVAPASGLPATNRTIALWFKINRADNRPALLGYGGSGRGDISPHSLPGSR